ncbi:hypothetical protein [Sphingobium yanoikuyae]|uniref:Uncharacterized protein n=1 Tax=Sphingobium yanoikuyae TaxID=13690 RepID=A0A430BWZ9_SPHYA|nr:hypothetical protein [Sphingobium yanoikuyae]KAK0356985.1 hypothetical protein LTR94_002205 [Friedmanniomyces endolithicus]RSU57221.1 hypothetical protein DAH51_10435 [Sphingobium yanoikuyae]
MAKTRASVDQFAFTFEAPQPATLPASLAGVDARVARTVAEALKYDERDRAVIAAEMSVLLSDEVTLNMLNGYASPARADHNISFSRMLALIAVTSRFDLLDRELREIGAAVLVGEEIHTAEIGHIDSEIEKLMRRRKDLKRINPTIMRNRRK